MPEERTNKIELEADMRMMGEDHHEPRVEIRTGPTEAQLAANADVVLAQAAELGVPIEIKKNLLKWDSLTDMIDEVLDSSNLEERSFGDIARTYGRVKITIEQIEPPEKSNMEKGVEVVMDAIKEAEEEESSNPFLTEEEIAINDARDIEAEQEEEWEVEMEEEEDIEDELEPPGFPEGTV